MVRSDNMSVVTYINKQGGTRSPALCMMTWKLFQILQSMSASITATHLAGRLNVQADHLSRHRVEATEWCLNREVVNQIFLNLGRPLIDLFASDLNHVLPTFCSWKQSIKAYQMDAFTLDWTGMECYAFPPICLIQRVLQQVRQQPCSLILIAPRLPRRSWFTQILDLLIDIPLILPQREDLLRQPQGQFFHPNSGMFKLVAWKISNDQNRISKFQREISSLSVNQLDLAPGSIMSRNTTSMLIGAWNGIYIPARLI